MTLRIGIAGLGYFSQFHQDAWQRLEAAGRCTVVAYADEDAGKRNRTAGLFPGARGFVDAARMIASADMDVLDIVTPPATHLCLVEKAAARQLSIICQKPLAPTFDEAVQVIEVAEAAHTPLIVHENFRFMPWFVEIHRLVQAGAVGRLLNISFRLRPGDGQGPDAYLARQPYFQKMPRFLIHETGIHLIDVFRLIAGEVAGVFARLTRYNPVIAGEDAGVVVFEFASGALGLFDGNRHVDHPADDTRMTNGIMTVEGTAGGGTLAQGVRMVGGSATATAGLASFEGSSPAATAGTLNAGLYLQGATLSGSAGLSLEGAGGGGTGLGYGIYALSSTLNGNAGATTLLGTASASATGSLNAGVLLQSSTTSGATVSVTGTGGGGTLAQGIRMVGGSATATGGALSFAGVALGTATGAWNAGIYVLNATLDGGGGSLLSGTGGGGTLANHGVYLQGITTGTLAPANAAGTAGAPGAPSSLDTAGNFFP